MDADWPLVATRFALYIVLSGLFGLSAFSLYALRVGEQGAFALGSWLAALAVLALALSVVGLVLLAANMAGTPRWPIDVEAIKSLLVGTSIGTAWKVRMVSLAIAGTTGAFVAGRRWRVWLAAASAGLALAMLAWSGHGAMDEGAIGWVHLIADVLHLLAAGAWVGALLGLILLMSRRASRLDTAHLQLTHRALHGFGVAGTIIVGTIVITGLVNGWRLVGVRNITSLPAALYGQLLLVKLLLFGAMLGLASLNRFRLTPSLERSIADDHLAALAKLRLSLAIETACVVTILALVAWLGTLEPPTSAM
ncbi:MAG: copper homeostasis membrane protein CopD [Sphingomicrobium sp.]|nr:copper homeostasis membrane protein CopD [Sphingomonadales bacterium]